jgi:hypothetical protein
MLFNPLSSRAGVIECLEGYAAVAGVEGPPEQSLRLSGAAADLREAIGHPGSPVQRREQAAQQATLRAAIRQADFEAAWEAGRGLSWEEAVAAVLTEDGPCAGRGASHPDGPLPEHDRRLKA